MISWRFFGPGGSIRQLHHKSLFKKAPLVLFFVYRGSEMWCGKEAKNHKYFIQKVVDISEIER